MKETPMRLYMAALERLSFEVSSSVHSHKLETKTRRERTRKDSVKKESERMT
jgi:hypothetical protein